jgi:UDP-N-acetylglucosamine--N-acetylmuramyl-(pentapeptide) pyrophosphoryl-undecaprenol N-acetylglucosamine transferase
VAPLKILLAGGGTGGHLYPALNIAQALARAEPGARFLFIGSRRGLEARVLPETGYPYHLLPLQPLYRQRPWRNWRLLAAMPAVAAGIAREFRRFDPHLVVGTGGYVSGPAVAWGRLKGCRTAIQEQNAQPGLVTRLLSARVDQLHLGYPEAESRLRVSARARVFAFGNPVSKPILPDGTEPYAWPPGRVLLVVGGSQGAKGLNDRLLEDLERAASRLSVESTAAVDARSGPRARRGPGEATSAARASTPRTWPADLSLVWIAGPAHAEAVSERVARLPWADRIRVVPFIEGLGAQLDRATLAVARAGAMLISEFSANGVPAVFVPLPTAAGGHQTPNAQAMVEAGAAEMREQGALEPGELWALCAELLADAEKLGRMAEATRARAHPDAADRIADALLRLARGESSNGCGRAQGGGADDGDG